MGEPILRCDFPCGRIFLDFCGAICPLGRHDLSFQFSTEVLNIFGEQVHDLGKGIGRLLLTELALLLFELPEFFLQLGASGGDGV